MNARLPVTPAVFGLLLAAGTIACGRTPGILTPEERRPLAVTRAATDLHCAESELSTRYLGDRLFAVSGCGKHATYRVICKLTVGSCYLIGGPDDSSPG